MSYCLASDEEKLMLGAREEKELLLEVRSREVPRHIAIIMDGNRRWAQEKNKNVVEGYWDGADTLISTVQAAIDVGVKVVTAFAFSTENWMRPAEEVNALMNLFNIYLRNHCQNLVDKEVRFSTIGNLSSLSEELKETLDFVKGATKDNRELDLVVAINYGGRDDLVRATRKLMQKAIDRVLSPEEVTEETLSTLLDTAEWSDPDLLIRTSGEKRISNFLLWQLSYSEVYFTSVFWPNFTPSHFYEAIIEYQQRHRRLGKS